MGRESYDIRVRGSLSPRVRAVFEPLQVVTETVIRGEFEDQAALHGVLDRIRELGIGLIEVRQTGDGRTGPGSDHGVP